MKVITNRRKKEKQRNKIIYHSLVLATISILLLGCSSSPTPYPLSQPKGFVEMNVPSDNITTYEGIQLGRELFYDPILSGNQSISCAFCHRADIAFTDGVATSIGIHGRLSSRSAPSLLNIGFHYKGVFWDGRSPNLEDQALHPVTNQLEMDANWDEITLTLAKHPHYPTLFKQAFGEEKITKSLVAKALAQFQRSLISADSKFDRVMREEDSFTPNEKRGWTIFFDAGYPETPMAECSHCHPDPLFTDLSFSNNGLDSSQTLLDFSDKGLGLQTGHRLDNGKFRVPTLRNIAVTAPYMHDGRFETLEEVIDHYNSGGHYAENVDPNVRHLNLSAKDKSDLLEFLNTLTDSVALHNTEYFNPNN